MPDRAGNEIDTSGTLARNDSKNDTVCYSGVAFSDRVDNKIDSEKNFW